jgi:hypothetical protein
MGAGVNIMTGSTVAPRMPVLLLSPVLRPRFLILFLFGFSHRWCSVTAIRSSWSSSSHWSAQKDACWSAGWYRWFGLWKRSWSWSESHSSPSGIVRSSQTSNVSSHSPGSEAILRSSTTKASSCCYVIASSSPSSPSRCATRSRNEEVFSGRHLESEKDGSCPECWLCGTSSSCSFQASY